MNTINSVIVKGTLYDVEDSTAREDIYTLQENDKSIDKKITDEINSRKAADLILNNKQSQAMVSAPYFDNINPLFSGTVVVGSVTSDFTIVYLSKLGRFAAQKGSVMYDNWAATGVYSAPDAYGVNKVPIVGRLYQNGNSIFSWNGTSMVLMCNNSGESVGAEQLTQITWDELKSLRDDSNLIAGNLYRITDFVTTTAQSNTKSAGHPFDVIVLALSENTLSEEANAILHEGDDYFVNCDLSAWKLMYCLDNDTTRFGWADETNGKGVIYRMIDERGNDCPYDFKNILMFTDKYTSNISSDKYYYTFSVTVDGVTRDLSVTVCSEFYGNIIKKYSLKSSQDYNIINFIIFNNEDIMDKCNSNTFGYECHDIIFDYDCYNNTFGNGCTGNKFGIGCTDNTFGVSCSRNTFGEGCTNNKFGIGCTDNIFVSDCSRNTFGEGCTNNKFVLGCTDNIFEGLCIANTFGYRCTGNTFGNGCTGNTFGNGCTGNTFGIGCTDNTFGSDYSRNTFGEGCTNNKFAYGCTDNIFEGLCIANTFGYRCTGNTFGNGCTGNTFGNGCTGNTFESYCSYRILKFRSVNTVISLSEEFYDDGSGQVVPTKHPDLSTQPSILPYKFMGQYVYEQLIPISEIYSNVFGVIVDNNLEWRKKMILDCGVSCVHKEELSSHYFPSKVRIDTAASDAICFIFDANDLEYDKDTYIMYARVVYTSMPEGNNYYGYETY